MEPDTAQLIEMIRKRQEKGLEQVMDLYMDSVYGLTNAILGGNCPVADVEECVQDVFLDVWERITDYDPNRGTLKTWILMHCKYKALNRRKTLKKCKVVELTSSQATASDDIESQYLDKEFREELVAAIDSLGNADREIFLRRYILEQDIVEIGAILGLTRQSVDNRLWRGRKAIRRLFSLPRKEEGL